MKESTKKVISLALAGTIIAGANTTTAFSEEIKEESPVINTSSSDVIYTVKKGETLTGISLMFYGDIKYYKELASYNGIENPDFIIEGTKLNIPVTLSEVKIKPNTNKQNNNNITHVVRKNDYLISIVRYYYGDKNVMEHVNKLATYNELKDPNILIEGDVLLIPELEILVSITPNDYTLAYQRLEWRLNHPGEEYPEELQEEQELKLTK